MEMVENGKIDTSQVHFSYVTNKVDPLREDVFRNVFQHFGLVKDVCIKKSQYHPVRPSFSISQVLRYDCGLCLIG